MAWYDAKVTQGFLWTPATPGAHSGIDIGLQSGTALTALLPGYCLSEGMMPWGGQVNIATDYAGLGPLVLSYLHNKRNLVKAGDTINPGDVIALSGSPPTSGPYAYKFGNGPHVHFEVSKGHTAPYMGHQGPSNPINGMFLITAARQGLLGQTDPNAFAALSTGMAAQFNQGVSHAPGFLPMLQRLAESERLTGFDGTNPIGSVVDIAGGVATRAVIVGLGFVLLLLVMWNIFEQQRTELAGSATQIARMAALTGAT